MTSEETIVWYSPSNPPAADVTVLVYIPDADEPIDFGFWDGQRWICASLMPSQVAEGIKAWADLPTGRIP